MFINIIYYLLGIIYYIFPLAIPYWLFPIAISPIPYCLFPNYTGLHSEELRIIAGHNWIAFLI